MKFIPAFLSPQKLAAVLQALVVITLMAGCLSPSPATQALPAETVGSGLEDPTAAGTAAAPSPMAAEVVVPTNTALSSPTPAPSSTMPPTVTPAPQKAFSFLAVEFIQPGSSVYQMVEFKIETDGAAGNPFDPAEVDLKVRLTSPEGKVFQVPAFWYQEFDRDTLQPSGLPGWRARFTPTLPGRWSAQAELAVPAEITSPPVSFDVLEDLEAAGFLRVSQKDPHYMAFDDGSFYFPVGLNVSWAGSEVLKDYATWLDHLSENGGNFIRVWMASWSFGLEWKDTGLGNYANRLRQAWLLDQVFKMAEERGIMIMLCLINHGAFSATTNPEWHDNPYNAALGGPLQEPSQFVTNPQAIDLFKRRLRYTAARWAYSPSLGMWEWWNEVNWTPIDGAQLDAWMVDMTRELAKYDPYDHLVTTSWSTGANTSSWKLDELNIAQQHDYSASDPMLVLPSTFEQFQKIAPDKPFLMGEYGSSAEGESAPYNQGAIHLHNGLWAAPFSGYAGTAMYWWWDNYIDPQKLWYEFRGISTFMRGETLENMISRRAVSSQGEAWVLLLSRPGRVLGWVRASAYNIKDAQTAYDKELRKGKVPEDWEYDLPVLEDLKITVDQLGDGVYTLQWFSTLTGEPLDEPVQVTAANGTVEAAVPPLQKDLAFKLILEK